MLSRPALFLVKSLVLRGRESMAPNARVRHKLVPRQRYVKRSALGLGSFREGRQFDRHAKCLMAAVTSAGQVAEGIAAAVEIAFGGGPGQCRRRLAQLGGVVEPGILALAPRRPQHQQIAGFGDQERLPAREGPGFQFGRLVAKQPLQTAIIRLI